MNPDLIRKIIEGALLAAGKPLDITKLENLFEDEERPPRDQIKAALEEIEGDCRERGFELKQVASGYRFQVRQELSTWVNRLWEEKPKRYSRAMLETLSLIAYRQPLTRGDIELVRGVAVSSDIIKTLQERDWVRGVGYRDVPGICQRWARLKILPSWTQSWNSVWAISLGTKAQCRPCPWLPMMSLSWISNWMA